MSRRELTAVIGVMILALPLGLLLEVGHVEASLAWDAFKRVGMTGRDEAAAGYLVAVAIHRAVQIVTLGAILSAITFYVALSRLSRRGEVAPKSDPR